MAVFPLQAPGLQGFTLDLRGQISLLISRFSSVVAMAAAIVDKHVSTIFFLEILFTYLWLVSLWLDHVLEYCYLDLFID